MEQDAVQMFLDAERELRKTPREREIEGELQKIAKKHREALVAESEPLFEELRAIELTKTPMPVVIDGNIYEYVGNRGRLVPGAPLCRAGQLPWRS